MGDIIYEKAKLEDAESFFRLRNLVWRNAYKDIYPENVFAYRESQLQKNIDSFQEKLSNQNSIYYVAKCNNKVVGIMYCKLITDYDFFKEDNYADLCCLYIHPDYQGKKIGSTFKNIFESWAKENGATKYVIGVLKRNVNACKTYEHWGGVLSEYESVFNVNGVCEKEIFYTINL